MSESSQSMVELRGLKATTMEVMLEFIYTEQVDVTVENVQELLPAACLLQLKGMDDFFLVVLIAPSVYRVELGHVLVLQNLQRTKKRTPRRSLVSE